MLEILKTVLPSPAQMQMVIEGMRNPMNSWDKSDSYKTVVEDAQTLETADYEFFIGEKDLDLMRRLAAGGPVHAKYRRMMPVFVTINAPLYWWKEFDTYKVGTVANSCSTMHKIHEKEFTLKDFSHDHLIEGAFTEENAEYMENFFDCEYDPGDTLGLVIDVLNRARDLYLETNDKTYWWQMIQLLPSSYNQKRTVMLNYEVLHNIYISRREHKLDEWRKFCEWIENLPWFYTVINPTIVGWDTAEEVKQK